jgi:uncharacterized membrane protein YphA (DoxX/SURF4 family)
MKVAIMIIRLLLGLMFFVFGLNQFFHFIPMQMPEGDAGAFFMGITKAPYFIPMLGVFQTLSGLCLLINKFVPVALIILFPITLNILLYHIFLDMKGMMMGILPIAMNIFLLYAYRNNYMHFSEPEGKHSHH